jgi:hypothetical protein
MELSFLALRAASPGHGAGNGDACCRPPPGSKWIRDVALDGRPGLPVSTEEIYEVIQVLEQLAAQMDRVVTDEEELRRPTAPSRPGRVIIHDRGVDNPMFEDDGSGPPRWFTSHHDRSLRAANPFGAPTVLLASRIIDRAVPQGVGPRPPQARPASTPDGSVARHI